MPGSTNTGKETILSQGKKLLKKSMTLIFYLALAVFLFFYLQTIDLSKLGGMQIAWQYLAIASLLGIGSRFFGTYIWFVLLKRLGAQNLNNVGQLIFVYAKSWMGRYIPGTAPWILSRIYFAAQHGVSKKKLAVSSLLEGGLKIVVMMALAILFLAIDSRSSGVFGPNTQLILFSAFVVCIVAMLPSVFNFLVTTAYRLLRRKNLEASHLADFKTIGVGAGLYAIGSIINGLSLFFIAKAVYPELSYSDLVYVVGSGSLASAAGMLAVFAPSGIGVREGIQLLLLSVIMPAEFALIITVTTRLWSVAIDFAFFGLSKLLSIKRPVNQQKQ